MNHRRIQRETESLRHYQTDYFTAKFREDNNSICDVSITTDRDSVYGKVKHNLEFVFPQNYPFTAPTVRFITPIRNICVASNGNIDLDILGATWSPAYSLGSLIIAIASFLNENDDDYVRSRQVKRSETIKLELIETVWANSKHALELDIY
jgi:ubiquitin-conjugating enzyme E2 C